VTPATAEHATQLLAQSTFCSGDCLYSFLFSNELLSNEKPDVALHFFKRTGDSLRPADEGGIRRTMNGVSGLNMFGADDSRGAKLGPQTSTFKARP